MNKSIGVLINSIMAGIAISIGATVYLVCENKVIGAFLFSIGLLIVCTRGLNLYTGKVCYAIFNKFEYTTYLPIILSGNIIGTALFATLLRNTRLTNLIDSAKNICEIKLNDNLLSLFILAIFCNFLIYIAVDSFSTNKHELGKYISLILAVTVFVVCGFEHCIADSFYFLLAGLKGNNVLIRMFIIILGNTLGGLFYPAVQKLLNSILK